MSNAKLTQDELRAIKIRIERSWNDGSLFAKVAEEDAPKLVSEVERLQAVLFHERVDADHAATHMDYLQSEVERLTTVLKAIDEYTGDVTIKRTIKEALE